MTVGRRVVYVELELELDEDVTEALTQEQADDLGERLVEAVKEVHLVFDATVTSWSEETEDD